MLHQAGRDFIQLDPLSAQLDLPVFPALENQFAVFCPGGKISGSVNPFLRLNGLGRNALSVSSGAL